MPAWHSVWLLNNADPRCHTLLLPTLHCPSARLSFALPLTPPPPTLHPCHVLLSPRALQRIPAGPPHRGCSDPRAGNLRAALIPEQAAQRQCRTLPLPNLHCPLAKRSFTFQSGSPAPTSNSHPLLLAPHCSVFLHLPNTPTPRSPTPPSPQYCSVFLQVPHTMVVQIPLQEISGRRSFQNRLGCSSM